MRSISVRELRSKSAEIWRALAAEQDLVVRSKGKPIAILSATTEDALQDSWLAIKRARATLALMKAQLESVQKGKDKMTLEAVNQVIGMVRKSRSR